MGNDLEKIQSSQGWLSQLNLPNLIAGPAGEALSRLIAGATDIPVALLEQQAQKIRTKTEGQKFVSEAMAKAVAENSCANAALVERATNTFLAKEIRKQANKEAIARKTVKHLRNEPSGEENPSMPEEDWFNMFEQYAEHASSEKFQEIWARVLAGEIRKPRSFSLRTLRFISELDQEVAILVEKCFTAIVAGSYMVNSSPKGRELSELLKLQELGLITGVSGILGQNYTLPENGRIAMSIGDRYVCITGEPGAVFRIPCIMQTQTGQEVYRILNKTLNRKYLSEFVDAIPKHKLHKIELGSLTRTNGHHNFTHMETLWEINTPE